MAYTEEQRERIKLRRQKIENLIELKKKELKPCPFCGDTPIIERSRSGFTNPEFYISCECLGVGDRRYYSSIRTKSYRNIDLVIKLWNKREGHE